MLTGGHRCAGTHQPRLLALTHPPPFPTHPGSDLDNPYTRSSLWSQAPSPSLPVRDHRDGPPFSFPFCPNPGVLEISFSPPSPSPVCVLGERNGPSLPLSLCVCVFLRSPMSSQSLVLLPPPFPHAYGPHIRLAGCPALTSVRDPSPGQSTTFLITAWWERSRWHKRSRCELRIAHAVGRE